MKTLMTPFQSAPGGRTPERPLFAIGDLHGHADALDLLLERIRSVLADEYAGVEVDLVYLGDFVDRGPDPWVTLDRARLGLGDPLVRETALMGNHDRYLVQAAGLAGRSMDFTDWAIWLANGGRETLAGLGDLTYRSATPEALRNALGPALMAFLGALQPNYRSGGVYCAHAGVDPDIALEDQTEHALLWIREPFLSAAARAGGPWPFEVTVVHGHTIGAHGVFANRIGVDTGGFMTGVFTAVEIGDRGARFHHIARED